ncbi:MAG: hypothetical protein ACO28S_07900, partial [Bacteroidia bacterium]
MMNQKSFWKNCFLVGVMVLGCLSLAQAQQSTGDMQAALRSHVGFLAHDSLQGRQTGSPSERLAASYLVEKLN